MEGWIKLHRCLIEKPIWTCSTPEQKVILITLMMMANHKGKEWEWKGQKFKCESGQFITSLDGILNKCGKGITIQNIRSALNKFEKYEFLTNESTKTGRLITIVNWRVYQADEEETNKADNKELTKNQQRGNKELTPNKNDNNDKNDKNDKNVYIGLGEEIEIVKLTESQYTDLIKKHGEDITKRYIEKVDLYCSSKGKTYKNYKSAILNFIKSDIEKGYLKLGESSTSNDQKIKEFLGGF